MHTPSPSLCLATALVALCTSSCGSEPPPNPDTGGMGVSTIGEAEAFEVENTVRLSWLLDRAAATGPFVDLVPAHGLEDLGDVTQTEVHREDFEDFKPHKTFKPTPRLGVRDVRGGKELLYRWGGAYVPLERELLAVVPAEPNTYYTFERAVTTRSPLAGDVAITEVMAIKAEETIDRNRLGGGGWGLMLASHRTPLPEPDGKRQVQQVSFFTTGATRGFRIEVCGDFTAQHGETEARSALIDDLRLVRVDPTRAQKIALMMARDPAPDAATDLGIEKFGQFPPDFEVGERHGPHDDNFSYHHGLYVPPPTDLEFLLNVPPGAKLAFGACLSRQTHPDHAATFEVLVEPDGGEQTVAWSKTLRARREEWHWHRGVVELGGDERRDVRVTLRTTAAEGNPHPIWGNPVVSVPPAEDELRHVIMIAVDTLRADRMSCYGYRKRTSPNLDAFCEDGVRFEQVASNANWTCPSFASLLTGLTVARHGVTDYGFNTPLAQRHLTIAERFRASGWLTHAIAYKPPLYQGGYQQGFDVFFNVPKDKVRGDDNLAEAVEWLAANRDRRSFLFLHFNDPHQPFTQPKPYDRAFSEDPAKMGVKLPFSLYDEGQPDNPAMRRLMRGLYDGEVLYVDKCIGGFLDALREAGLYDNAAIALVSDHGEQLWEHGGFGHGYSLMWDEVVRVPMIIKAPATQEAARGTTVATHVRGFDVMPTLLEMAGIEVEDGLDAESLMPLLTPGAAPQPDRLGIVECSTPTIAARTGRWKYVLGWSETPTEMLFDLKADPGEKKNVAATNPDVLMRHRVTVLDHLMSSRPGNYVVAIGPAEAQPKNRTVKVKGIAAGKSYFGLTCERPKRGTATFEGNVQGPLLFVADISPTKAPPTATRYERGDLARLLREDAKGLHRFEGPPPPAAETGAGGVDPRLIEAMKALGYTGK